MASRNPQSDNGYDFHMEDEDGCELQSLVFSKDTHPGMRKEDEHEVRFKLVQDQGMTLEFAQSRSVALWVAWGSDTSPPPCPETQPDEPDTIFFAEKSSPNSLKAVNTNPSCRYFSFALNFVDPHSSTPNKLITYDPAGQNQDGGITTRSDNFLTANAVAVGVAAIAVVAVLYLIAR